jgi:hypothetical protein
MNDERSGFTFFGSAVEWEEVVAAIVVVVVVVKRREWLQM